ncbi:hypothetical protein A3K73_04060 [Candidatus Pacearchaeota archaeon RBG_13_36_9]|nr:MAG: hypothetical protein A3K73_04060 [Candidatus Pacearchaeota archaeon RBG_13_36_9]
MKGENYLIFIVSEKNLKVIINQSLIGFRERFLKTLRRFSEGDKAILYVKGKNILGVFKLNSTVFLDENPVFKDEIYPLRIKLKKYKKLKKKEFTDRLIKRLSFITNKKYWMGNFQGKSVIILSKKDFKLLEDYLNEK